MRLEARLAPNVRYYSVGSVDVLSTGNTMTAAFSVKGKSMSSGAVTAGTGLLKLGNSGESGSPGTAQRLYYNEFGGTYRYLGTGERTTKGLLITTAPDQAGSSLFDGGLHGGLEFCDSSWTAWNMVANLVLAGTNASPCVIHSPIVSYARAAGTNHCMTLTKRGSGTWRLAHSLSRDGIAGLCIEEGVMQIDSLYEKGEACALGAATTNYPANYMGVYDPLSWVPYSIALGAPGKTAPLLELVGTNGAWSSKREFVLRGDARIKNSALDDSGNAVPLRLSGFSSVADGVNTLFLEGNGSGEDEIGGLSDGEDGRLALVKNGGGNWYLVGTNTFTGGLAVSNGTLTILSPSGKYTWYRWIVKQTKGNGGEMIAYEFGLYDANSNRVNSALSMNPNYASIRGGQVSYQKRMTDWQNRGVKDADRLFDDSTTDWRTFDKSEGARPLSVGDPASWFCVLMKLDADCEEVCSYDVVANGTSGYAPAVWTLEASVDGFTWDEVDNVDSIPFAADSFKWAWGTKTKYSDGTAAVHGGGRPIAGNTNKLVQALSPDCPVSVAPGATLACRGTATLANLSIDCNGAGTIDGFGFAAAGTLNVQNLPEDGAVLPVRFTNVSGAANIADWSLFVNGVPNGKCKICVSGDGEIRILKPGTVIVFR